MPLTLTSNIDAVMARFSTLATVLPVATRGALATAAVAGEIIAVASIEEHTPVGRGPSDPESNSSGYQHLRDTTEGETLIAGATATIIARQKKMITIRGEMFPLAALLKTGHDAPATPILPVAKRALFWAGLPHPVGSSRGSSAPPNPYIAEATAEAIPLIDAELRVAGTDALRAAITAT